MRSKHGKVKFPKRERKRLEAAMVAIREIEKRGAREMAHIVAFSRSYGYFDPMGVDCETVGKVVESNGKYEDELMQKWREWGEK